MRTGHAVGAGVAGLVLAAAAWAAGSVPPAEPARELRVCADPNNLPFSNVRGEGFENRLAELIAEDLDAEVRYTWWAQRRGFLRNTLNAGACDVVLGVPSSMDLLLTTRPYYRSTYVFVHPAESDFVVRSLDDPVLRRLTVGVHLIGDDFSNAPPAHALASRGIVGNVRGYSVYGDYTRDTPPAALIEAVAGGEVDLAIVWGPLAGYFAPKQEVRLEIVPVSPEIDLPFLPMVFDIAVGVRRGDELLRDELDAVLAARADTIGALLESYGVPRLGPAGERNGGRP